MSADFFTCSTFKNRVNFTNRKIEYHPIWELKKSIPCSNIPKYLGMNLDSKLRWKVYVKIKRGAIILAAWEKIYFVPKQQTASK